MEGGADFTTRPPGTTSTCTSTAIQNGSLTAPTVEYMLSKKPANLEKKLE